MQLASSFFFFFTSVCSCAGTTGCPSDCEVIIWPNGLGESDCLISFDFNEKLLIFEGEQRSVPAFPLLEVTPVVTVVLVHFTAHAFALRPQALFSRGHKNPVSGCPAHVKAAAQSSQQAKSSGLISQ